MSRHSKAIEHGKRCARLALEPADLVGGLFGIDRVPVILWPVSQSAVSFRIGCGGLYTRQKPQAAEHNLMGDQPVGHFRTGLHGVTHRYGWKASISAIRLSTHFRPCAGPVRGSKLRRAASEGFSPEAEILKATPKRTPKAT